MTSTKKFTVTFKVAEAGAPYEHHENKGDSKAGDLTSSTTGQIWHSISDGVNSPERYGFVSRYAEPFGEGYVSTHDDFAYRVTAVNSQIPALSNRWG